MKSKKNNKILSCLSIFKYLFIIILVQYEYKSLIAQQNITIFYNGPDIPTSFPNYDPTCNGPAVLLHVTLPPGGPYQVVQTQIAYGIEATAPAWRSDQRSKLVFVNNGNEETEVTGFLNQAGIQYYSRGNDIANGFYPGGTVLEFELYARRTWNDGSPDCGTNLQKIISSVYDIILQVQYLEPGQCLFDGITFTSQNQLDLFPINYPGCTEIFGNVIIEESLPGDIEFLNGLSNLTFMHGLEIKNNSALQNLTLTQLTSIQNSLVVSNNDALINFNGLNNLSFVQGLIVEDNDALVEFSALSNLNNDLINVTIRNNSALLNLDGLQGQSVLNQLVLEDNSALQNLTGLNNLSQINSNFILINNGSNMTLVGLANLQNIIGNFTILNNNLINLSGAGSPGGLTVHGDVLLENNPGLTTFGSNHHLRNVMGNFTVRNNGFLLDFLGSDLESVGGDIIIENNANLLNFDGLQGLITHDANIQILYNPSLINLEGLENLTTLNGNLTIEGNEGPFNLVGLGSLTSLNGDLNIVNNQLTGLHGFGTSAAGGATLNGNLLVSENYNFTEFGTNQSFRIGQVNGNVTLSENADLIFPFGAYIENVSGDFIIKDNPSLEVLFGLASLSHIGGNLIIENNSLLSFSGFSAINNIGGNVLIKDNPNLTDFNSMKFALNTPLNYVDIINNTSLINLEGLSNVPIILGLRIQDNHALTSLNGLDNLLQITQYLDVYNNNNLLNLNGLSALETIGEDLSIQYNNALLNLIGLSSLITVDHANFTGNDALLNFNGVGSGLTELKSLQVMDNISLQNFSGLNHLTKIDQLFIVGNNESLLNFTGLNTLNQLNNFQVFDNMSLLNFEGLDNLNIIQDLYISGNVGLQSFTGLTDISQINILVIESNNTLENLIGLESLTTSSTIALLSNNALQSLDGLDNINPAALSSLSLQYNHQLSYCHIDPICIYLFDPGNYAEISFNNGGCDTRQEVESECLDCDTQPLTTITFTGSINQEWENPANWDLNRLPNPCDDVIIFTGLMCNITNFSASIKSLQVNFLSTLNVVNSSILVENSTFTGLSNSGTINLDNSSTMDIINTTSRGCINDGTINVNGSLNFQHNVTTGFFNSSIGEVNISATGSMNVTNTTGTGIENYSSFVANGSVSVYNSSVHGILNESNGELTFGNDTYVLVFNAAWDGVRNRGMLTNNGFLTITYIGQNGINNLTTGTILNNHWIDCENSFNMPGWFISNSGNIENSASGLILSPNCSPFTNVSSMGILMNPGSNIDNYGQVVLTGQSVQGAGAFNNHAGSSIIGGSSDCDD